MWAPWSPAARARIVVVRAITDAADPEAAASWGSALARRARKRREGARPSAPPPHAPRPATNGRAESPREAMARGYARGREKDEAAREALVPFAPGERPWPIALSAVLAALFAIGNVVLVLAGWDSDSPVAGPLSSPG